MAGTPEKMLEHLLETRIDSEEPSGKKKQDGRQKKMAAILQQTTFSNVFSWQ